MFVTGRFAVTLLMSLLVLLHFVAGAPPGKIILRLRLEPSFVPSTVVVPRNVSWSIKLVFNTTGVTLKTAGSRLQLRGLTAALQNYLGLSSNKFDTTTSSTQQFSFTTKTGTTMYGSDQTEFDIVNGLTSFTLFLSFNVDVADSQPTLVSAELGLNMSTVAFTANSTDLVNGTHAPQACSPDVPATVYNNYEWMMMRRLLAGPPNTYWLGGTRSVTPNSNKFCWTASFGLYDKFSPHCSGSTCTDGAQQGTLYVNNAFCSSSCTIPGGAACTNATTLSAGMALNTSESVNPMRLFVDNYAIHASEIYANRRVACQGIAATNIFTDNLVLGNTSTQTFTRPLPSVSRELSVSKSLSTSFHRYSPTPRRSRSVSFSLSASRPLITYSVNISNNTGLIGIRSNDADAALWGTSCSSDWGLPNSSSSQKNAGWDGGETGKAVCAIAGFEPSGALISSAIFFQQPSSASTKAGVSYDLTSLSCPKGANTGVIGTTTCGWGVSGLNCSALGRNDTSINCFSNPGGFSFRQDPQDGTILVSPNASYTFTTVASPGKNSLFGTICRDRLPNSNTRRALCNLAGGGGRVTSTSGSYMTTRPPSEISFLSDLSCSGSPSATGLPAAGCSFLQSSPRVIRHACNPITEGSVGVDCYTSPSAFEFTIANATFNNRLFARHNSSAPWGLVCPYSSGDPARTVVFTNETSLFFCKQAKVNNSVRAYFVPDSASLSSSNNSYGFLTSQTPAYLDRVVDCPWYGDDLADCGGYFQSTQDLQRALSCNNSVATNGGGGVAVFCVVDDREYGLKMNLTSGAVLIRDISNASAAWGTLCNKAVPISRFTAGALCNLMKWPGVATAQSLPFTVAAADVDATAPIYAHSINCGSTAASSWSSLINPPNFQSCSYNNESADSAGCSHNNDDVGVNCHIGAAQWVWNQTAVSGAVRVAPKSSSSSSAPFVGSWGSVCGSLADATTATAVCRMLGWKNDLDTTRVAMRKYGTNSPLYTHTSNGTVYFANFSCSSSTYSSSLLSSSCSFVESADQPQFERFKFIPGCDSHVHDLELDCYRPQNQWSISQRAIDGFVYAHIVQSSSSYSTTTGSICALQSDGESLLSDPTALSLCNMLGYTNPVEVRVSSSPPSSPGSVNQIFISNLTCSSTRSNVFASSPSFCNYLESLPAASGSSSASSVSRTACSIHSDNLALDYCHIRRDDWNVRQLLLLLTQTPSFNASSSNGSFFNPNYNLVELRPSSSSPYGTICNGYPSNPVKTIFDGEEKKAICSLLGWNPASVNTTATTASWKKGSLVNNNYYDSSFKNLSYMSNFTCNASALSYPNPSFADCNYTESSPTSDRTGCSGIASFNETLHLHLDCRTHPKQFQFRISYPSGRLETRPNSTAPWGTVCSNKRQSQAAAAGQAAQAASKNRLLVEFSEETALGFCRLLGMPQATWARVGSIGNAAAAAQGLSPNAPIYLQNLSCPSTNFNSLEDCNFDAYIESADYTSNTNSSLLRTDCSHDDDVTIFCFSSPSTWEFRINDATSNRVLARPNASSTWGGVCASAALVSSGAPQETGQAVCNWLRYPGKIVRSAATTTTAAPGSAQEFFLSDLTCRSYNNSLPGNKFGSSTLANCTYNQSDYDRNYHTCNPLSPSSQLVLDCHSDPSTFALTLEHQGAQVAAIDTSDNVNGNGWGYICNDPSSGAISLDTELALCGMLGWPYPVPSTVNAPGRASVATSAIPSLASYNILSDMNCPASSSSSSSSNRNLWSNVSTNWKGSGIFPDCVSYKQHTSAVASACNPSTAALNISCKNDPSKWEAKIDAGDENAALEGLLWVRPGPTSPWGTVCFAGTTIETASTFCHMTGVTRILDVSFFNISTNTTLPGMSNQYHSPSVSIGSMNASYVPQYLSQVVCPDNKTFSLEACTYVEAGRRTRFSLATPAARLMYNRCNHGFNLGISCRAFSPTPEATETASATATSSATQSQSPSRSRESPSASQSLDHTATHNRKNSSSRSESLPRTPTKSRYTRSATPSVSLTDSNELWHPPFIRTAASQLQAAVAMGAASTATLLFREPTPPLTASRALAIAAMSKACRNKEYVTQPFDEPLLFPQQSLLPGLKILTEQDHYVSYWRQHYRGAVVAGMFVIPFGGACLGIGFSLLWHLAKSCRKRLKSAAASRKKQRTSSAASDHKSNDLKKSNSANLAASTSSQQVPDNDIDLSFLDDFTGNVMTVGGGVDIGGGGGESGDGGAGAEAGGGGGDAGDVRGGGMMNQNSSWRRFVKFWDDIWVTSRVPTIIAVTLAIALENVTASCVMLLSYDSGGWPYNKSLDRGLAATALVVFTTLLIVAALKTRGAVRECDCVDAETVRGSDPPEKWQTRWSRLLYGERCWALSRDTELNRANSDVPAARLLKLHLRFVGPFHGRNLMRPTEGYYRFRLTPWTFVVEMIFTAVLGFGRGFLMSADVRCLSAAIWTMVLIAVSVLWNWILRPRISPLMALVDLVTFGILLAAAIATIADYTYSDDLAGFGAMSIALGTLVFGGLRFVFQKCRNIRLVPLVKTTDIEDIDIEAELMDILGGGSGEEDCFMKPPMDSALLSNAAKLKGGSASYNGHLESLLNVEFENCDDIPFNELYLQCRELVADGAAKNAKSVRELRSKMKDRALEIAQSMDDDMRQQLALNRIQRRAEMIAAGRDPDSGRTFKELCDPDRPFRFDDDPTCRQLMDDYRKLVNVPNPDARLLKDLEKLAVEIEKRQEALANLSEEARRRLVREEAKRNADRFRQYLSDEDPFERAFTCSDDPEFKKLQQCVMEKLRNGVRQNAIDIEQLQEQMIERAQQLRTIPPYQRQQMADQARQERARQLANGIDPETGKSFDELCSPNRAFEYTDDPVYKALSDEYKHHSENPVSNKDTLEALLQQMKLRSKVLDHLSPEEKAALVRQTAARNAARLRAQFDWGGDPLGPASVFLSSDDSEYRAMMDTVNKYLREDPHGRAQDIQLLQLEMRLRADELAKRTSRSKKDEMIAQRRKDRLAQILDGVDPFTGRRFADLVDDKRAFELDDDPKYRALHNELDFLCHDNAVVHESRIAELQTAMANRAFALSKVKEQDKMHMVKDSAASNADRIRRMMNYLGVGGPNQFLLTDDPEYGALQRQLMELLASGKATPEQIAALQERLRQRAAQLALLNQKEKNAMMLLRQQNNTRLHKQYGRDPFTGMSYEQLADPNRNFYPWDDGAFDGMARELRALMDSDPIRNAARIDDLLKRMQSRGILMNKFGPNDKRQLIHRTANCYADFLQRYRDEQDPFGPNYYTAGDDLLMKKMREEASDLSKMQHLLKNKDSCLDDFKHLALEAQISRFPSATRLSDAEKKNLLRIRREEAARFAASARDWRTGKSYEELIDTARPFELTDDAEYEQLVDEHQFLSGEDPDKHNDRLKELMALMLKRAGELELLSEEEKKNRAETRVYRNMQQYASLPSKFDPLGAGFFTFTDDSAYKKIHDDMQALLRRPMSNAANDKLEALKKQLLNRARELTALEAPQKLRMLDARRSEMLRMRKHGIDPLSGKPYGELCDRNRAFQYTDDPVYRRKMESYLFYAGSNPDQHERRLKDLAEQLRLRQAVIEKWDDATKKRLLNAEIDRLERTRRRDLLYGISYSPPPDRGLAIDLNDLENDNDMLAFDLEADLADLLKEDEKPTVQDPGYALEDDEPGDQYQLDDDDQGDTNGPGGIGAAKNEELMRRMMELKQMMDTENSAGLAASGAFELTTEEAADI